VEKGSRASVLPRVAVEFSSITKPSDTLPPWKGAQGDSTKPHLACRESDPDLVVAVALIHDRQQVARLGISGDLRGERAAAEAGVIGIGDRAAGHQAAKTVPDTFSSLSFSSLLSSIVTSLGGR
jgi:hypothetical protein